MTIREAIQKSVEGMIKPTIHVGVVKSVNETDMTCVVDLTTAPDADDVRIRAAIDQVATGLLIIPKVGSTVLIARIEGKIESPVLISYTDIQKINIVTEDILQLNGDSLGGLVRSDRVKQDIDSIKQELNDLKILFNSWVPVPQDGGAALKASLASWAQPLQMQQATYYESEKVKHGS